MESHLNNAWEFWARSSLASGLPTVGAFHHGKPILPARRAKRLAWGGLAELPRAGPFVPRTAGNGAFSRRINEDPILKFESVTYLVNGNFSVSGDKNMLELLSLAIACIYLHNISSLAPY